MNAITIENAGGAITATNYFDSEYERAGKMFLSVNAGTFRLLVPDNLAATIAAEMRTARDVVITLGPRSAPAGIDGSRPTLCAPAVSQAVDAIKRPRESRDVARIGHDSGRPATVSPRPFPWGSNAHNRRQRLAGLRRRAEYRERLRSYGITA